MKIGCRKPSKFEWIFCLLLIPVGIYFTDLRHYSQTLSSIGLGGGVGALIGLSWSRYRYHRLSPEEKREQDRMERDERNRAIQEKAATFSWRVLLFALLGAAVLCMEIQISSASLCFALIVLGVGANLGAMAWFRHRM
ncbi:hypothetical protein [Flavonifractor sp. An100]|uniref:hypothetical protein n=1 Tax=Flavonifractor sp. An100 TaxID=1965538 RepID=UPI000B38C7B3|nr:hypothetical protein [Flavonifractor sp. An100]OUQ79442.1 hypothetical protein B5E43_05700 [Flavonifractor sp. An100]